MRCIIVEEDSQWVNVLTAFVLQTPFLELANVIQYPPLVMALQHDDKVDLLLISTRLSYLNGFELASTLKHIPQTIFIGSSKSEAYEAFEHNACDFLLKPLNYERFMKAVQTAHSRYLTGLQAPQKPVSPVDHDFFWVKSDYQYIKVPLENLLYIEGLKDYLKLYIRGKEKPLLTLGSLKKIEEKLPSGQFKRIHRSYIVSLANVESVQRNLIKIGNAKISIGENYKDQFFKTIIEESLI